jgi:pimeloyl-ACP methyl ester carboxylesterase
MGELPDREGVEDADSMDVVDGLAAVGGRPVAYCVYGPSAEGRVVFEYGTPGTRRLSPQQQSAVTRAGVQLLVIDRPGYGESGRLAGRRIVDVVQDVQTVTDLLGWEDFCVWGGSGGGPHALACAALLGERVLRCASVVGAAPFDAADVDWFAGMSQGNIQEFELAIRGESAYRPLVQELAEHAVAAAERGQVQVADDYHLPAADVEALRARTAEDGYHERVFAAYARGIDGWVDDSIALVQPWGFDLVDIARPVSVWFGLDDVLSPRAHGEYLARAIPHAEIGLLPSGGHILTDRDLDDVYAWLL